MFAVGNYNQYAARKCFAIYVCDLKNYCMKISSSNQVNQSAFAWKNSVHTRTLSRLEYSGKILSRKNEKKRQKTKKKSQEIFLNKRKTWWQKFQLSWMHIKTARSCMKFLECIYAVPIIIFAKFQICLFDYWSDLAINIQWPHFLHSKLW